MAVLSAGLGLFLDLNDGDEVAQTCSTFSSDGLHFTAHIDTKSSLIPCDITAVRLLRTDRTIAPSVLPSNACPGTHPVVQFNAK